MRPFNPPKLGVAKRWFAETIENRLSHSGEYVNHMPTGESVQPVVMNYQFIPDDQGLGNDFVLVGTNPALYGLIEHFEHKPKLFRDGDSIISASGSQFEIRGLIYNVKRVDVNHRGYMKIELVQSDLCAEPRTDFDDDMGELVCYKEPNCDDT